MSVPFNRPRRRLAVGLALLSLAIAAYLALQQTLGPPPAAIHVRWAKTVSDSAQTILEERYALSEREHVDDHTWAYILFDTSPTNIEALVRDPAVTDTADIDRTTFTVTGNATEGRYPSAPYPMLSTLLWAATFILGGAGAAVCGMAVAERLNPGITNRALRPVTTAYTSLGGTHRWMIVLILGTSLGLSVASMKHLTLTYDEPEHLDYGHNILIRHDATRLDDSSMPILALNAIPLAMAMNMPRGTLASFLARPETARYVTVAFSVAVAMCLFVWARDLYGTHGAMLALALYAFDPNLLAHSQLITTDVYVAGTILFTLYAFWNLLRHPSIAGAVATGLVLGIAEISKYTAIALYPLLGIVAVMCQSRAISAELNARQFDAVRARIVKGLLYGAIVVASSLVIINIGFLFQQTFTPLVGYTFESPPFRLIQARSGPLGYVPLPLPYPYLQGLDLVMQHERTGAVFGRIYLFEELREGAGFPGYYFYACLYKLPLGTLFIMLFAGAVHVMRRPRFERTRNESALWVPIAFFTIYFNFFYRAQIGLRHFLVVLPLIYICCGAVAHGVDAVRHRRTAILGLAVTTVIMSTLSYYPHFLPYFNELLWDRRFAYTILADSNVDWGQAEWYVRKYLAAHPGAVVDPPQPTTGTIVVHVNALTGVTDGADRFAWLREHFEPTEHIAYAALVYQLTPGDLERARAAER